MCPRKSNGKLEPANSLEKDNTHLSTPAHSGPIPASGSKTDSPRDHLPEMEIDFAVLEDGSLAEMIEDPVIPTKSILAVYKGTTVKYVEKWRNGHRLLIPRPRPGQVLKPIGLPGV